MVKELRLFSRRQLMATASLAASTAAAASFGIAYASQLRSTPGQILGPFWPTQAKPDLSGDLTRVPGSTGRAMGQVLHVSGRVLNRDGMPVPNAKLDIWQANSFGRYRHPSDRNPAPLDPNFNGFAELASDADGSIAKSFDLMVRGGPPGMKMKDTRGVEIDHQFAERTTFIVAKDGKIAAEVATVNGMTPAGNVEKSLQIVQDIAAGKPVS